MMKRLKNYAKEKLKFTPLTEQEKAMYQGIVNYKTYSWLGGFNEKIIQRSRRKIT